MLKALIYAPQFILVLLSDSAPAFPQRKSSAILTAEKVRDVNQQGLLMAAESIKKGSDA